MFNKFLVIIFLLFSQLEIFAQTTQPDITDKKKFSQINYDTIKNPAPTPQDYSYRHIPDKDSSTIQRLTDSIENALLLNDRLRLLEALLSGSTPMGIFNLDYKKLINFNEFEGLKLGFGIVTNKNLSDNFSFGGYITYAFHDKQVNNGMSLQLFPNWLSDIKFMLLYHNDPAEVGGYTFLDEYIFNQSENFRSLDIDRMMFVNTNEADFAFRPIKFLKVNLYANKARKTLEGYYFNPEINNFNGEESIFHFTEIGINLKFSFRESFFISPGRRLIPKENNYPVIWINIRRGIKFDKGEFVYTKYEFKFMKIFTSALFGQSRFVIAAGKITGDIPVTDLYNGHASYAPLTIDAENTFATMRMDEFNTSSFASLFFRQKLNPFFNYTYFHPRLILASNIGFGGISNSNQHGPVSLMSYNKGYYESGVLINDILVSGGLINLGFGVFYRYGPYTLTGISNNFNYRITLDFNLK